VPSTGVLTNGLLAGSVPCWCLQPFTVDAADTGATDGLLLGTYTIWVKTLPVPLCRWWWCSLVIYLRGDVVEVPVYRDRPGSRDLSVCFYQCCWHLRMSRSFLKASLEHFRSPSLVALAGVALSCDVPVCVRFKLIFTMFCPAYLIVPPSFGSSMRILCRYCSSLMDALPSLLFGWILCHLVASGAPSYRRRDGPLLQILCRILFGGCFAAVAWVNALRRHGSSLLGGYFVTVASSPVLVALH
jgi:hypothetical protein